MCTREELNGLIGLLLYHVDRAAGLGAKIQYEQEQRGLEEEQQQRQKPKIARKNVKQKKAVKDGASNQRLKQLLHFHSAYFKYLIFALDPYTEILVPLSASSSLTLYITNFIRRQMPQTHAPYRYTSRTVVEFLQVSSPFDFLIFLIF